MDLIQKDRRKEKRFWRLGNHLIVFTVKGTITANRMIITSIPNMR